MSNFICFIFIEFVAMMNDANPWFQNRRVLEDKNCNRVSFLRDFQRELVNCEKLSFFCEWKSCMRINDSVHSLEVSIVFIWNKKKYTNENLNFNLYVYWFMHLFLISTKSTIRLQHSYLLYYIFFLTLNNLICDRNIADMHSMKYQSLDVMLYRFGKS